jgi:N-methylhydantoinase B
VEILEQHCPILFQEYALREGSGEVGRHRGGFGISYRVRMLPGEGKASFLMDHGLTGPSGLIGGEPGATNEMEIVQGDQVTRPEHRSKGEGYLLRPGDRVQVRTPGAGYGRRPSALGKRSNAICQRGYYNAGDSAASWDSNIRCSSRKRSNAAEKPS